MTPPRTPEEIDFANACREAVAEDDAAEHEAIVRGDASPEEVAEARGQMRAVPILFDSDQVMWRIDGRYDTTWYDARPLVRWRDSQHGEMLDD